MVDTVYLLIPEWPAPASVRAVSTTRLGGVSRAPYNSLNLGDHVGDEPQSVAQNRKHLRRLAGLPSEPVWLQQVHGTRIAGMSDDAVDCRADGMISDRPGEVCVVMTADCLPVLLCNRQGDRVGAVHAGWRGLADGVIEAAIARFEQPGSELLAWMGPAIGPDAFEVGNEVRDRFLAHDPSCETAFRENRPGHWLADIYLLARLRLKQLGIGFIGGGGYCTVSDRERFFSYRRDGVTGRMASLIWIE